MKMTKRPLAVMLMLLLMLGIAPTATANTIGDPAMPRITGHNMTRLTAHVNQQFTLRVTASAQNGDPMGYQWYVMVNTNWVPIEGATQSSFSFTKQEEGFHRYRVIVYNANDSELPMEQRRRVVSNTAQVTVEPQQSWWQQHGTMVMNVIVTIFAVAVVALTIYLIWAGYGNRDTTWIVFF